MSRLLRRHPAAKAVAAVGVAALTLGLVAAATTRADGATHTCRGQEATHVGEPGGTLRATDGRDVIVTNGAETVRAKRGADLICITGAGSPQVWADAGDDDVDATRKGRGRAQAILGAGDDTYLGHRGRDWVSASWRVGVRTGDDWVSTRRGRDMLSAGYRGRVRGSLGRGKDVLDLEEPTRWSRVDGGRGRDWVYYYGRDRNTVRLRLDEGWVAEAGRRLGRIPRFEDARVFAFVVRVHGTRIRNRFQLGVCRAEAHGKYGHDTIRATSNDLLPRCNNRRMTFYGGPGDDRLRGWFGPDRLYGGRGVDLANGALGRDLCRAERKRNCER